MKEIIQFINDGNEAFFKEKLNDTKFIDDALYSGFSKIKKTPYWYIALLIEINNDSMGYVVKLLHNEYLESNSIMSAINLLIGMYKCTEYVKSQENEGYNYYQNEINLDYSPMQINKITEEIHVSICLYLK